MPPLPGALVVDGELSCADLAVFNFITFAAEAAFCRTSASFLALTRRGLVGRFAVAAVFLFVPDEVVVGAAAGPLFAMFFSVGTDGATVVVTSFAVVGEVLLPTSGEDGLDV